MKKYLIIIIALFIGLYGVWVFEYNAKSPVPVVAEAQGTQGVENLVTHPVVSELAADVNAERAKYGLSPLVEDVRLEASAAAKCADEDKNNYHAPLPPDGRSWESFFLPEYQHSHIGENLSWGYTSSQKAVDGWMGSPTHKASIIDPTFVYAGYAVCSTDDGENLVVQHFKGL